LNKIKSNEAAWHYIQNIDFSAVNRRVAYNNPTWTKACLEKYQIQYCMMLYIFRLYPNDNHAPSIPMDEFWHEHLLYTKMYYADSEKIFGHYLHHTPGERRESIQKGLVKRKTFDEGCEYLEEAYLNTRRQISLVFGNQYDPEVV
jgi:hypothetical protein